MSAVGKVSRDVEIATARTRVTGVTVRDVEPFDRPVVSSCADLWFAGAATPRENHGSNSVQMASETELELKVWAFRLLSH